MHIIHISYLIYIYATVPWTFEKHNIPLINNVVALYAILPLGEFWITILLERLGMFFQETSWQRS